MQCWISHDLLTTVLRAKNRMAAWVQNGCQCLSCLSSQVCDWQGDGAAATAQHHKSIVSHIASLGKDQNSKSVVQFLLTVYHFCIIKSKKIISRAIISQGPSVYFRWYFSVSKSNFYWHFNRGSNFGWTDEFLYSASWKVKQCHWWND